MCNVDADYDKMMYGWSRRMFPTTPTCGAIAASCICNNPDPNHDLAHTCACGGSWLGEAGTKSFDVISWPGSNPDWVVPA